MIVHHRRCHASVSRVSKFLSVMLCIGHIRLSDHRIFVMALLLLYTGSHSQHLRRYAVLQTAARLTAEALSACSAHLLVGWQS